MLGMAGVWSTHDAAEWSVVIQPALSDQADGWFCQIECDEDQNTKLYTGRLYRCRAAKLLSIMAKAAGCILK